MYFNVTEFTYTLQYIKNKKYLVSFLIFLQAAACEEIAIRIINFLSIAKHKSLHHLHLRQFMQIVCSLEVLLLTRN